MDPSHKSYQPNVQFFQKSKENICLARTTIYSVVTSLAPEIELFAKMIVNHNNPHRHAKYWQKLKQVKSLVSKFVTDLSPLADLLVAVLTVPKKEILPPIKNNNKSVVKPVAPVKEKLPLSILMYKLFSAHALSESILNLILETHLLFTKNLIIQHWINISVIAISSLSRMYVILRNLCVSISPLYAELYANGRTELEACKLDLFRKFAGPLPLQLSLEQIGDLADTTEFTGSLPENGVVTAVDQSARPLHLGVVAFDDEDLGEEIDSSANFFVQPTVSKPIKEELLPADSKKKRAHGELNIEIESGMKVATQPVTNKKKKKKKRKLSTSEKPSQQGDIFSILLG